MWLEISADEIRILNEKYEEVSVHQRLYDMASNPVVDWIEYLPAITRKPNAFKYTSFFKTLPKIWQDYFNTSDVEASKKMLNTLTPLIVNGKLDDATTAMELSHARNADSFLTCYRSLTEETNNAPEVITPNTPQQTPYKQDLSVYSGLMRTRGEV